MKKTILVFYILMLASCNTFPKTLPKSDITLPSAITLTYPPCYPFSLKDWHNDVIPILKKPLPKLSEQLFIQEYDTYFSIVHPEIGGCRYGGHNATYLSNPKSGTVIILNEIYTLELEPILINSDSDGTFVGERITIFKTGVTVYEIETGTTGSSGLLQAWAYDDHWVIEFITAEMDVDIIYDGQSQKFAHGYDEVFGFQILADRPFYFFRQNDSWGINFDNQEYYLNYDDIPYTNISIGMDVSVTQYQNMVLFQAERDNQRYSVVIGVFPESP